MTSLEFFDHSKIGPRLPVDWGTLDLQSEKFDPTIIKAPSYLLKNQPIEQIYRKTQLELSNVRRNDQLMPSPFTENMLEQQIQQPFPMDHPWSSHIAYTAMFPSYTAPEDRKRGELALKNPGHIIDVQTPAHIENTLVVGKTFGNPWRHEVKYANLPSQRKGVWFPDQQYYHLPKPDGQQFYPFPPTILVPNPKLRVEQRSIDQRTANVLRNKEREMMQTTQQACFFKDGLGTQAPLNSDNLAEKIAKYETTGKVDDSLRPYFKRGSGISQATSEKIEHEKNHVVIDQSALVNQDAPKLMTKLEKDEILMETGRDYKNYPEPSGSNPFVKSFSNFELNRSNTMPDLRNSFHSSSQISKEPANKLDAENRKIVNENHQRVQTMQLENRMKDVDLITPDRDIRLLRIKHGELENARGAQPNLKQNVAAHVNTLYSQEGKYVAERSDLYRTPVYNPYQLKQYIDSVKPEPKQCTNYATGPTMANKANFSMPDDSYEHRPKLFAHKVFDDFEQKKRAPLEKVLTEPLALANEKLQENGFILKQSTYGDSYNTKKFLQENESLKKAGELIFEPIEQSESDNVTLKSNGDVNNESKLVHYPRLSGPIPPEPYEKIYCNEEISEMSNGYAKRYYSRVYDSPNVRQEAKYEALRSDLDAIAQYENKAVKDQLEYREYLGNLRGEVVENASGNDVSFAEKSLERAARRLNEPVAKQVSEQLAVSTYKSNYTPYRTETPAACPSNEFYKNIEYTKNGDEKPRNLLSLQDGWSKSMAHRRYHSAYPLQSADLRENVTKGKKIIYTAPGNAYKFALLKN